MGSYAMPQAWCPAKVSCGSSPGLWTGPGLQPAVLASQAESGCGCLECSLLLKTPGLPAPTPQTMLNLTCDSAHRMTHCLWKLFLIPSLLGGHCPPPHPHPLQGNSSLYSFHSVLTQNCVRTSLCCLSTSVSEHKHPGPF